MKKQLETYFIDVITGKERGLYASLLRGLLFLLSLPFRVIVACRNWGFDQGWFRRYSPPVPVVISIGNIVMGGTGKTPVTLMLAKEFYDKNRVAILSRGYRSLAEKLRGPTVLCNGNGPLKSAAHCGDEPYLLAQNLPKSIVIVGRNKHQASNMAAKAGAEVILLDDGMQHRHLARDFEVVVVDMADPFGQGHFLPRGLLREGVNSLGRAHLVIFNHVKDKASFEGLKAKIGNYTKAPIVGTRMDLVEVVTLTGEVLPSLQGIKVGLFCGIAHPEYFHSTVEQHGGIIVANSSVGDHRSFDHPSLQDFAFQCRQKGAEWLLCTEKDKVKIDRIDGLALPVAWVRMRLSLVEGNAEWELFTSQIKATLN